MSSTPQNPEQPVPAPAPTPPAAAPSPPSSHVRTSLQLDAETLAAIEAAMRTAVPPPAPPRRQAPPSAGAERPGPLHPDRARVPRLGSADRPVTAGQIRGPRVVQAGREQRSGAVVSVGPTDVFVEFGPKELGVVPRLQWPDDALPKVGDTVDVVVDNRDSDGLLNCSRPGLVKKAEWELLEPGQVIEARVSGVNKGGLELEVAGHSAFMPASQVALEHIADLSVFVGEKLKCKVTRVDRIGRGNIVLSRREILDEERKAQAEQLKTSLAEGQTVEGTVRKIMPFGAFVDLGGVDGLIHVSDLTHDRVGHGERFVEKYVKAGEKVRVQILKLDWAAGRLSLGLKQTQADPFAQVAGDVKDGAELTGRVTKIMEFGAFVELAPGVEGLVHISELAWRRVAKVEDVLKPDEVVKVKVLKIDPQNRRVSLSIKALAPPPEAPAARAGGGGGRGGRGGRDRDQGRPLEEIQKVTPELRRLREKFHAKQLKGGIA